jgi:enterobactin synthetase component D
VTLARLAALRSLLPDSVQVAGGRIDDLQSPLFAAEEPAVLHAVISRRAEFTAGRSAARQAMAALGHPAEPLPKSVEGPPVWPPGLTGSIAHGGGWAFAIVAPLVVAQALGIDLEVDGMLTPDLIAEVLTDTEQARIDPARATAVFSAKEAAFKAQFMLTGRMLGFGDIVIRYPSVGRFAAQTPEWVLTGRQTLVDGLILSVVMIPIKAK